MSCEWLLKRYRRCEQLIAHDYMIVCVFVFGAGEVDRYFNVIAHANVFLKRVIMCFFGITRILTRHMRYKSQSSYVFLGNHLCMGPFGIAAP